MTVEIVQKMSLLIISFFILPKRNHWLMIFFPQDHTATKRKRVDLKPGLSGPLPIVMANHDCQLDWIEKCLGRLVKHTSLGVSGRALD
jgi:hypothetical protein